jgi:outer membrane protein OmpA-like peptidoglycan-associated protein
MPRVLAGLALAITLAGCAATPVLDTPRAQRDETVILLPGPDGKAGTLTVTHERQQRILDEPYASARLQNPGALEDGGRRTAEQVQRAFGEALSGLPPRPMTFTLHFQDASDDFTPESKAEIARIVEEIRRHPAPDIVVVGHTDRVGSVTYNDALSLRRAERVRTHLVGIGIAKDRIREAGRGEREPLVPTDDEVAEPRNRRVEVTVR